MPVLFSVNVIFSWLFHFDASACQISCFSCLHCAATFKGYIFLQFYCVYVFSIVKSISEATQLEEKLASNVKRKRTMQVASKKGASRWLATLPIAETGFALHKGAFRDALCLRYGGFPSICWTELNWIYLQAEWVHIEADDSLWSVRPKHKRTHKRKTVTGYIQRN